MQYRKDRSGNDLSILGYGCMRFTKNGSSIDLDKAEQEVMEAYHSGVNYFDTAYLYPGNEVALGEILKRNHIREKVNVATKLPIYIIRSKNGIEKYFQEELKRLQTDYIDYYLMHMITDIATWEKFVDWGIVEWAEKKKQMGQIRHFGFSFHGNSKMFLEVLNAYDWDFCQIQYNYIDETSQAGRIGLEAAGERGIPVIIMEPLRGGKLVDLLPDTAKHIIAQNEKQRSPAEWAFRWLWNQPQVTVVLSGMNTLEMVRENVQVASQVQVDEFTEEDNQLIESIREAINASVKVGCTGCEYCMPCPHGVDIPTVFRSYNKIYTEGVKIGRMDYLQLTAIRKKNSGAGNCIECGACEAHCPQNIQIRKELQNAKAELETLKYKAAKTVLRYVL